MKGNKIQNSDFSKIGIIGLETMKVAGKIAKAILKQVDTSPDIVLRYLASVMANPENYIHDDLYGEWAKYVLEHDLKYIPKEYPKMLLSPIAYEIYGAENIEQGALQQMNVAMRLPISLAGALMPDAHQGYGLPIGGVLATKGQYIIPYAVGVDIACRMCLSVFDVSEKRLYDVQNLKKLLGDHTRFGLDGKFENALEEPLFDDENWTKTGLLRRLKDRAVAQVGSSGTGNHFVEFGVLEINEYQEELALPVGKYMALLSHSGSRGFGANIANHYSKIARDECDFLPKEAIHLSWLDLETQAGQEYWLSMNLAGEYASACHHHIHKRIAKALGIKPAVMIENHHNFAWKETLADGTEVMVHRKGATPAGKGVLGIIPGSMTAPGYVVRGRGEVKSINSASHGAGRRMSRTAALNSITKPDFTKHLAEKGVALIGGGLDEAPMAYKDINEVINNQSQLVDILAKFTPKIVRMAEPDTKPYRRKKGGEDIFGE